MSSTNRDSPYDQDDLSNLDETEKVGDLPLKDDSKDGTPVIESKRISSFFGPEKYPAEYYFKETQRYIRQGQHRKAFIILDKFYERNKQEAFSESLLMKLARRYVTAGLNVLHQYEVRDELQTKSCTMVLLKKLSTMIILWYQALIKILDRNRGYNQEFIVPEQGSSDHQTPNPLGSTRQASTSGFVKKTVGPSTFSNLVRKLEKEKRDEQKAIFRYPELSLELIMTDLIDPSLISFVPDNVNIANNLIDFWCLLIDLLLVWSQYFKKMQDAWTSYKFLSKAESFIEQKFIFNTDNTQLLEISQRARMMQGQLIMELGLFSDAVEVYRHAFQIQHQILSQQISAKSYLPKETKKDIINMANEKIEKIVCKMCVCLLNLQNSYEQIDKIEQGMECLRLLYWFSITFIKHQQYSDLLNESYKVYQLYSSKYDELIAMNGEINKVFSIGFNRGQKYLISSSDEVNKQNEDFLVFINNHLYKKSQAEEVNETLVILNKRNMSHDTLALVAQGYIKNDKNDKNDKNEQINQQLYYSAKSNHSINSQHKLSKINDSKETYYTDANTTVAKAVEGRIDDSITIHHNNNANTTSLSKKESILNRTTNGNFMEALLTQNEESPGKTYQQSRIQIITNSFMHPLNQTADMKSSNNLQFTKSTQNILSSTSLNKQPQSATSVNPNKQRFNLIKSVAAFESTKKKEKGHQSQWDRVQQNKKRLNELQQQQKEKNAEILEKYQPKLVSSNKFFQDRHYEHNTDAINLKNNKELEVNQIFGVHKKKKYNILEHDVDTFADNIIAREILTRSNCLPYKNLQNLTDQNLSDYHQEKNEFGFCRKILQLKKQGMTSTLNEKEKDFNVHELNNEMDRDATDTQNHLFLNNELQDKKKSAEEAKRIQSLNLNINLMHQEKPQDMQSKFKKIMFNHSKKLGLSNIKKNLKKITQSSQKSIQEIGSTKSFKNLLFVEDEEQLDDAGRLKKTQNINKETIKLHLTELDHILHNASQEIAYAQKNKYQKTNQSFTDFNEKKPSPRKPQELTIGEKISRDYGRLSTSTKYYVAKHSGQKINSFFDLVNSKLRLGKMQKEQEQKHRLETPIMKKTLNEAVRRASHLRMTLVQHNF